MAPHRALLIPCQEGTENFSQNLAKSPLKTTLSSLKEDVLCDTINKNLHHVIRSAMKCIDLSRRELSPRKKRLLTHLLTAKTVKEAAEQAKVRLATAFSWLRDPVFKGELDRLRHQILEDVVNQLRASCMRSVETLVELRDNASETVRRGCANDLLEHYKGYTELKDLEARLEIIEQSLKQKDDLWPSNSKLIASKSY